MEKEQLVKLVTAAQNGDTSALNDLFSAFYEDVFHMALKTVKDENLAFDIVQETFLEIYQTLGKLQEPAAFVTWTKQITFHQCTRYFKKKKDVIVDENEDGGTIFDNVREESAEFIPDEALDQDEFKKTVLAMLDELSEEQRSATVMYYFDELSVKDIAEIQGVSEGTVKSRLNYARKSMRALVEDYENKNGIKLHTENDFSIFKWLLQPVSNKDLAERRAKVLSESLTNATGVEFSIALEENSSEPTEKAAAPAPKKKMFGGITTTTVVVSLAAAVILIAILFFGFVLKMFDNFFDRFNAFGSFGGGASSSSSINTSSVDDPSTIVSDNDSEVSGTEEPDVSSDAPVSSSEPTPSSTPTSSSQPTAKNECFGSDTSFRDNQVDIRPKHVYWEDGYLCVEAYVINGCPLPVQNINVNLLSVSTEEKGSIASGAFSNTGIATISPYYNRIHTFRFRPADVIHANADLTDGVALYFEVGFDKVN